MTTADSPGQVHPEFWEIFQSNAKGFEFEPNARRMVLKLLSQGTDAVLSARESLHYEELEEAKSRLSDAMSSVANELRSRGITVVDESSLGLLMRSHCPLPPFCYDADSLYQRVSIIDPSQQSDDRPDPMGV